MNFVSSSAQAQGYTEEQWNARVDLAAAHLLIVAASMRSLRFG